MPDVETHPVEAPRVAVMHTWSSTQQEGWLRIGMDEYEIPYDYISVHEIRDIPDLKSRWDVIVIGAGAGDALSLLRGVQGDEPIPWKKTDVTPNLGVQDETDDMRGGMELQGIVNLDTFLRSGGVLVTLASSSDLPVHFGFAEGVSVRETQNLWAPGGVFRATLADPRSPLAYGFDEELGVYFNRGPVFATGGGGRRGFGMGGGFGDFGQPAGGSDPGSTTARNSGRGGINDTDIIQGRPRDMGEAGVEAFREQEAEEAGGQQGRGGFGGGTSSARIIARFAADPADLLISGGLNNGSEMAGAPAVVDAPLGDGHVVLFSFNPFWRGETLGAYGMVFNAFLHHQHLGVGG
jgi:hypothetical protein